MRSAFLSRLPLFGALAFSLLATACVSAPPAGTVPDNTPFLKGSAPKPDSRIGAVRQPFNLVYRTDPAMLKEIRSALSGKTVLFVTKQHGPQIEYYSANGKAYLWYPGNTAAVPGTWTVSVERRTGLYGTPLADPVVCTTYGPNTYNPVTGSRGATPECLEARKYGIYGDEIAPGDIFGLATGRVPFILQKHGRYPTLDQLADRAGAPRG